MHVTGPAAGPPLLFVHGVGGGAWSFAPQAAALADTHRCYAWEARGHGEAARVADAGLGDYYRDANEALDTIVAAARDRVWIAGHSMGGLLALALGAERARSVRGLVLVDPVYAPDGGTHLSGVAGRVARRAFEPLVASMLRDGIVARALARAVFAAAFVDPECRDRAWRAQRTQVPTEYPKMMYEAFDGPTNFPNRAFARDLDCPTLLLEPCAARRPRFPTLVADLERLGERFTYLAIDGGHYLQLDRSAARVTQSMRAFLARWQR